MDAHARGRLRLALEAGLGLEEAGALQPGEGGAQGLDGDGAGEARVGGAENLAEAALTEHRLAAIAPEDQRLRLIQPIRGWDTRWTGGNCAVMVVGPFAPRAGRSLDLCASFDVRYIPRTHVYRKAFRADIGKYLHGAREKPGECYRVSFDELRDAF